MYEDKVVIDHEAKLSVSLKRILLGTGVPYYIGKLQFPGTLDLKKGITFMVFTSDADYEEMLIGPMDHNKRSKNVNPGVAVRPGGKIVASLHEAKDQNGNTYYIGEAMAPAIIECYHGIFFSIFVHDLREIQISMLDHDARRRKLAERENNSEYGYKVGT